MRIAIVDDDRAFLGSLVLILRAEGHRVTALGSSSEALKFFAAGPPVLDVLILDYLLPDGTGCELLQEIREALAPGCKVIMVTGHSEILKQEELKCMGVSEFIPKPLDLERLYELIGEGVAGK